MNLDETGVPLFMGDLRGSIMWEPRAGRGKVLPTQNAQEFHESSCHTCGDYLQWDGNAAVSSAAVSRR